MPLPLRNRPPCAFAPLVPPVLDASAVPPLLLAPALPIAPPLPLLRPAALEPPLAEVPTPLEPPLALVPVVPPLALDPPAPIAPAPPPVMLVPFESTRFSRGAPSTHAPISVASGTQKNQRERVAKGCTRNTNRDPRAAVHKSARPGLGRSRADG